MVLAILVAIFAPLIVTALGAPDPNVQNSDLLDDFGSPTGPSADNWLGVDQRGRDVLARVVYGTRISLEVAFISTAIIVVVGVILGLIAGYYRGITDSLLTRTMMPVRCCETRARSALRAHTMLSRPPGPGRWSSP